ncbi:quinohemoprotein amine dehydrogenase [Oikeobacillus pervagus]|uniref:Quinohemoprotein amine dehydrogenase n=1 Tax=Oikeobacillus pervagus TaxID=1325931 RepID=A0AAJ1T785_9BACI|nr:quinohemoprotein amine dehydrogenase subunit alpha [Oikeobacillus pervagus]MDQ0215885.1 quinohemoprotein amine dehydrogenase [Oikeobacillus pervagus]
MVKKKRFILPLLAICTVVISACAAQTSKKDEQEKEKSMVTISEQVEKSCISCHAVDEKGKLERIGYIRKTPEGWSQTIARMERLHGLSVTEEEREQLIMDLSRERGLAPEETEKLQYWLANKPSYLEANPENEHVANACISCHASGRFEAQRRTEQEWKNLKDFHLVMYPSIYLNHRHTDWPKEADKAIAYLAKKYGEDSKVWNEWKNEEYNVNGKWKVVGFQGTKGFYIGESEFKKEDKGYSEKKNIRFLNGDVREEFNGNVRMYTGYMLRSQYLQGENKVKGTYSVTSDNQIKGDWSLKDDLGITAEETYYKVQTEKPEVVHLEPLSWKKGEVNEITMYGMNLSQLKKEDLSLPKGVELVSITDQSDEQLRAVIKVDEKAKIGKVTFKGENAIIHGDAVIFDQTDYIKIEPGYGVSRIGDEGPMNKMSTQYVAYVYSNGKDGKKGTKDDLNLGPVQADWSLGTYPEKNATRDDRPYIGNIDKNGLYTPNIEGVNKDRAFVQENVGSATVIAKVEIDGKSFIAKSHHIATVPDYDNNIH